MTPVLPLASMKETPWSMANYETMDDRSKLVIAQPMLTDYVNRNSSASRPSNDSMVNIISIAGNDDIENRVSNHNIF